MNTDGTSLTYVYAVARQTERLEALLVGLGGIDDAPVTLLTDASDTTTPLAFVISHVPQDEFSESALKAHFEDLEWLEGVARAHHEVVQAVAAEATVLPLRMATVYQDDPRARQALGEQRRTLVQRMASLDAHTEYGVKIYLPPPAPPTGAESSAEAAASDVEALSASPGKAYLQRRRVQHHARERIYEQAQRAAAALEVIAARYTSQRVRHAPQTGALTGPQENVLNDAYLVRDADADGFRAAIAQSAQDFPEIRIEVTGPWAPYSFAMPPAEPSVPADEERAS
ncbi:GvpL/GvpF family gas vesicle protein [Streptomyces erythrochromogenes]|uniref:GvpL/GvpF family gas vesicle protein n=1 Tax=Streptomyces erythrochromogenes TaxID=285574 RepID=UPI0036D1AC96